MSREYEGKVAFLGIGGLDRAGAISGFVREHGFTFPNAIDRDRELFARFGTRIQDTWVFLNEDGTESGRSRYEELSESNLRSYLDELVRR